MGLFKNLARPSIWNLKAYSSARSIISETTQNYNFMDANESPCDPHSGEEGAFNRYPQPRPKELLQYLAKIYDVDQSQILLGRGADDAIDVLIRTFCEANSDGILICPPTYGVYEVFANIQGAKVKKVPLSVDSGYQLDLKRIAEQWEKNIKLIFICSPNNPTGNLMNAAQIESLCSEMKDKALVVLDEAYVEFSGTPSLIPMIFQYENLVVLRTLSKAWALAGARCGVAVGHSELIDLLQKVIAPYPLSAPTIALATKTLSGDGPIKVDEHVNMIVNERERLQSELGKLRDVINIFPSHANFLLIKVKDPSKWINGSLQKGIVLRDRSSEIGCEGCVRITVGNRNDNDFLINTLKAIE